MEARFTESASRRAGGRRLGGPGDFLPGLGASKARSGLPVAPPSRPRRGRPVSRRNRFAIEYRPLFVRTVLNEQKGGVLPFQFSLNPYRGCEFGCAYCFACYTHGFLEDAEVREFDHRIFVKLNAADALRAQLRPGMLKGRPLAIGTATDPYQPAEKHYSITRGVLKVLAGCPDLDLSITTKSPLILRDLDLLQEIGRHHRLHVNITITTLNSDLSRLLEGKAPSPQRRLELIRELSEAGIPTVLFAMPVIPGINDRPEELLRLYRAARRAGAVDAAADLLHLERDSAGRFLPMVEESFPHLAETLQPDCGGCWRDPAARERLCILAGKLREQAGFPAAGVASSRRAPGQQLELGM